MSEMIERVARAIYERTFEDRWDALSPRNIERALYLEVARAAIAAMREPTEEMVKSAPFPVMYNSRYEGIDPPPEIAWQRMIDTALSERPETEDSP